MSIKTIFAVTLLASLSSCSFNNLFLHPTRLNINSNVLIAQRDTLKVKFEGSSYQPVFFMDNGHEFFFDYSIESVVFESLNGNILNGWLLKPKGSTPTVTLLHFHGNASNILRQHRTISPLLDFGFQIFVFDYSGFGFSQGKATVDNVLVDAHSALNFVKSRSDMQNTKLLIYGHSLGGHLAAVVASQRQDDIDGLVIESAFSSHKDIAACRAGLFGRMLVREKYSAVDYIGKLSKPVLIIHSVDDNVVPFKLGKKLYANANEPKEFLEINGCHICGPRFYADSISKKIFSMILKD